MKMINLDFVEDVVIKKEVTTPANGTQSLTPLNIEKVMMMLPSFIITSKATAVS